MIDYFALLEQPRRPWLDPECLQEAFREKTLRFHPDARAQREDAGADDGFARLNAAYQILQDPKRRLQHLLSLEDGLPQIATVPKDIADLFPTVAAITQEAAGLKQQIGGTTSALSRSLLEARSMDVRRRINDTLVKLSGLYTQAEAELRRLSQAEAISGDPSWLQNLQRLYLRFSYLTRWIAQLEEKRTEMAIH